MGILFVLLALLNIYVFKKGIGATYFDSSFAQLTYSYILHTLLIFLINGYLLLKK